MHRSSQVPMRCPLRFYAHPLMMEICDTLQSIDLRHFSFAVENQTRLSFNYLDSCLTDDCFIHLARSMIRLDFVFFRRSTQLPWLDETTQQYGARVRVSIITWVDGVVGEKGEHEEKEEKKEKVFEENSNSSWSRVRRASKRKRERERETFFSSQDGRDALAQFFARR